MVQVTTVTVEEIQISRFKATCLAVLGRARKPRVAGAGDAIRQANIPSHRSSRHAADGQRHVGCANRFLATTAMVFGPTLVTELRGCSDIDVLRYRLTVALVVKRPHAA